MCRKSFPVAVMTSKVYFERCITIFATIVAMLLTNHALTGAALALGVNNLAIVPPAAFMSHLALDSLPHFGIPGMDFNKMPGTAIGVADCFGAMTAYLTILHFFPQHWPIITVGVFFACLPDLFYVPQVLFGVILDKGFRKLHAAVQWSETPMGLGVDIVWAIAMIRIMQTLH